MRGVLVLALALALSACGQNAERKRQEDERAIAAVEAAQRQMPPLKTVTLQDLSADDRSRIDGEGGRCRYAAAGAAPDVIHLVTMGSYGWLRIDSGEMMQLAADTGSTPSPARTWSRYTGKQLTLRIEPARTEGLPPAAPDPGVEFTGPVTITVRDAWDRIVASGAFTQDCVF